MVRHLQIVEANYALGYFGAEDGTHEANRVAEAMAAYGFNLAKGKVAGNGVGKVILCGGKERLTENLFDVLRHTQPLEAHGKINALVTPHERFVGQMHHVLSELGKAHGWDVDALDAVHRKTMQENYRFSHVWTKPRWNSSKTCSVGVEWRTTDRTTLGFTMLAKDGIGSWIPLFGSPIGFARIDAALGRFAWNDDQHAVLWHGNRRDHWVLDIATAAARFVYAPAEEGSPHGQYQLAKMYLDGDMWVDRDMAEARRWLKLAGDRNFTRATRLLDELDGRM